MAVAGIVCAILLMMAAAAQAATVTVTRTDDPVSPSCTASNCSLRGAVNLANTDGGSDTIVIPAGTYQLTAAAGGELQVDANMTLVGAGARSTTILPPSANTAIQINSGDLTVNGVTFANSTNTNNGGAIFDAASNGALTLNNDSFTNNGVAGSTDGGAIQDRSAGQLTINASTFSGNQGYNGGALYSSSPTRIVNSTFVNNAGGTTSANGDAGAMQLGAASSLVNDTITGNECFNGTGCGGAFLASAVSIADSIVAGNHSYNPGTHTTSIQNCSGTLTITGPDLTDGSDCTGFTVQGNPQLGPLQNNGGPTDTMEPAAGSPAVGTGTNSSCAPVDQRGGARPKPGGGNCDIGSVELDSLADTAITGSASPSTVVSGSAVTYTLTVVGNGPDPAILTTVKDLLPAGATLIGAVSSTGSCSGTTVVTCSLGTVAPGVQTTIAISASLSQAGTATDVATLNSPATDPNPGNDQATLTTTVAVGSAQAPALTALSQSHSRWRLGSKLASFARKRAPVGTVFGFTLNQAGRVILSFSHQVKAKCGRRHGRHRHRCTRTISDGRISSQASPGHHRVSFDGVINRRKRLRPGSHTVTIVAINGAGKSSPPKTLRFTIVR